MIYFDYNASTPIIPAAKTVMQAALNLEGNPSSTHTMGRLVNKAVAEAKDTIREYYKLDRDAEIFFTSGATEANNMAIKGFSYSKSDSCSILAASTEHLSVLNAGITQKIAVDSDGILDIRHLETRLEKLDEPLVCLMAANNETGIVQPIEQIAALVKQYKGFIHVDAVQATGRLSLNWQAFDSFSISAHKFGGPTGVGALIVNNNYLKTPLIHGGGQQRGYRAGTENIIGIIGMAAALKNQDQAWESFQPYQRQLEKELEEMGAFVIGKNAPRLSNTTCVALPEVTTQAALMQCDLAGICLSGGSACSSGTVKPSHVLQGMGADESIQKSAIRISCGWNNTADDYEKLIKTLKALKKGNSRVQ